MDKEDGPESPPLEVLLRGGESDGRLGLIEY